MRLLSPSNPSDAAVGFRSAIARLPHTLLCVCAAVTAHLAVARLRSALYQELTVDKLRAIVRAMIKEAKGGNVRAAHELLARSIGHPARAADKLDGIKQGGVFGNALVGAIVDRIRDGLRDDFAPPAAIIAHPPFEHKDD